MTGPSGLTAASFVLDSTTGRYTYYSFPGPLGNIPYPVAINDVGQAIVKFGYTNYLLDLATGAFTYLNPISTDPGTYKGNGTEYFGLNDLGQTVGSYNDPLNNHRRTGFIRDANGSYMSLSYPGALGTTLSGINNAGQVIGIGYDLSGGYDFIATPVATDVPEPASLALVSLGIVGVTMARHRRKTRTGQLLDQPRPVCFQ